MTPQPIWQKSAPLPIAAPTGGCLRAEFYLATASVAVAVLLGLFPQAVCGDVLHMTTGRTLQVEILEDLGSAYRLRTKIGIVDVDKDQISRIEKRPSPWQRYAAKRRKCMGTADAHYRLAEWCKRQGLGAERLDELEQVIALDPDHAAARAALGFIRSPAGRWIKQRSARAPTPEQLEARRRQRAEQKLLTGLISDWFLKVRAIYRGRMASEKSGMRSAKFRAARKQILAIRDPLALPALTGVLSTGGVAVRLVLVEALSRFDRDEATMNLLVMALLDPSSTVRQRAAEALRPRHDDRVIARLRYALRSNDEHVLRHAAAALGILKARSAVEDLIPVLSTYSRRPVRVSRPIFFGSIHSNFGGYDRIIHGHDLLRYRPNTIGVLGSYGIVGTVDGVEMQTVANHRTEVQDALIAITGRNFGFDQAAWSAWWRGQKEP